MKTFSKQILLAAILASSANANVAVRGDTTIGLKYNFNKSTANKENQFEVTGGNQNQGFTHVVFAAAEGGQGGQGAYVMMETLTDIDGDNGGVSFNMGQEFVGYRTKLFDVRLGQMDSLVYNWVGSLNEKMLYADNIAVVPASDQDVSNILRLTTQLGPVRVAADVRLKGDEHDYEAYDIGAQFNLGKANISVVHQTEADINTDAGSGKAFEDRDTTALGVTYDVSKNLNLMATYANYDAERSTNGEDNSYSLGLTYKNASILYQTSDMKDQARYNVKYDIPLSDKTTFGIEGQFGDKYYNLSNETVEDEFVVGYIHYNFS